MIEFHLINPILYITWITLTRKWNQRQVEDEHTDERLSALIEQSFVVKHELDWTGMEWKSRQFQIYLFHF